MSDSKKGTEPKNKPPTPAGTSGPSKKPQVDGGMPVPVHTSGTSTRRQITSTVTRIR
jgi:hypothetical protein